MSIIKKIIIKCSNNIFLKKLFHKLTWSKITLLSMFAFNELQKNKHK